MVKPMIFSVLLFLQICASAQKDTAYATQGLLKFNLGLSQGHMLNYGSSNTYLNGYAEYFPEPSVSIRGDCFAYVDARQAQRVFDQNLMILFGAYIHKQRGRHDLSLGAQPGVAICKPHQDEPVLPYRVNPALGITAGYQYYFSKYCHFFLAANYLTSAYRGSSNGALKLGEWQVSGGLGFHLKTTGTQNRRRSPL